MKKILSLLTVLIFVLVLSGCDDGYINDTHKECVENGGVYAITDFSCDFSCDYSNVNMALYYTQEEINQLLQDLKNNDMCILEFTVYEGTVVEVFEEDLVLVAYKNYHFPPLRTTIAYGYEVGDTIYIAVYEETDIAVEWWKAVENCED